MSSLGKDVLASALVLTSLESAIRSVCPIDGLALLDPGLHTVRIDFTATATAQQRSDAQAVVSGFDWTPAAQATRTTSVERANATALITSGTADRDKALRATAAVAIDEINLVREWIVSFKAAVAASTNLANLQTRVAALPDLPDRTLAQAKTAWTAKISSGVVD
jgi:hypothetical protein